MGDIIVPPKDKVRKLNIGDVVFFKECQRMPGKDQIKINFKGGTGFAVMLGIVPPAQRAPSMDTVMMLMGQAGYISFDDVVLFLGKEHGEKCVKMFEEKYYPKRLILPPGVEAQNVKVTKLKPVPPAEPDDQGDMEPVQ